MHRSEIKRTRASCGVHTGSCDPPHEKLIYVLPKSGIGSAVADAQSHPHPSGPRRGKKTAKKFVGARGWPTAVEFAFLTRTTLTLIFKSKKNAIISIFSANLLNNSIAGILLECILTADI